MFANVSEAYCKVPVWHRFVIKHQFADAVFAGQQKKMIARRRVYNVGDGLRLFARRGDIERRLRTTHVVAVTPVRIDSNTVLMLDGVIQMREQCDTLARELGFDCYRQLFIWLHEQGLPVEGQLVEWL